MDPRALAEPLEHRLEIFRHRDHYAASRAPRCAPKIVFALSLSYAFCGPPYRLRFLSAFRIDWSQTLLNQTGCVSLPESRREWKLWRPRGARGMHER